MLGLWILFAHDFDQTFYDSIVKKFLFNRVLERDYHMKLMILGVRILDKKLFINMIINMQKKF